MWNYMLYRRGTLKNPAIILCLVSSKITIVGDFTVLRDAGLIFYFQTSSWVLAQTRLKNVSHYIHMQHF